MPARSPFIGRLAELSRMGQCFSDTRSGRGTVVFVSGELGIGKTRLIEEFASAARENGAIVAQGRSYESAQMPAYTGFRESLLSLLTHDRIKHELDFSSPFVRELARLGPEFASDIDAEARSRRGDSLEDERYRLWRAVGAVLKTSGAVAPTVIVLDDLQWADAGSLGLVGFLGYEIKQEPVVVVGAYREEDVGETHPLRKAMLDLVQADALVSIHLDGLSSDEVGALAVAITESEVAAEFISEVHRQTGGNPLFVEELMRQLAMSDVRSGGPRFSGTLFPGDIEVPEALRAVVTQRLSRLSPGCQRLLRIAAVIGRDFDLPLIERAGGPAKKGLLRALEVALENSILREVAPGIFSLTHPIMRSVIYRAIKPAARLALHRDLAEALKERHQEDGRHAGEIAHHLVAAGHLAEPAKVLSHGLRGARRARALFAYEEARHLLLGALRAWERLPNGQRRQELY